MTIQQALDQKVWAVIGATHKTEKFGYKIYKCLKDHGYEISTGRNMSGHFT